MDTHIHLPVRTKLLLILFGLCALTLLVELLTRPEMKVPLQPSLIISATPCEGTLADCAFVNATLNQLPQTCRRSLRSVTVRYDHPDVAGFTTVMGDVWIAGDLLDSRRSEFRANVIHEYGHVVDFLCLTGSPRAGGTPFTARTLLTTADDPSLGFYEISWSASTQKKREGAQLKDFVSGYAEQSAVEDFAESYAYYVLQNDAFKQRARRSAALRQKYDWMRARFPVNFDVARGATWNGRIPNTVSSMAFDWYEGR